MRFTLATSVVVSAVLAAAVPQHTGKSIGTAIPVTKLYSGSVNADKTVNFRALDLHVASVDAKIIRGLENYERNTGAQHPFSVKTVEKRASNVPLTETMPRYHGWHGTISVGTPPKYFTVSFDTGCSDFILPTSACSTCKGLSLWDPASSSTMKMLNKPFVIKFADKSAVSGLLYNDTVSISGFTAIDQILAGGSTYSSDFTRSELYPDGLMGMAFQSLSVSGARPIIETFVSQHQVAKSVFSFKLASPGAELYIGGANSALYTGIFTYVPVMQTAYWQVNIDNIQALSQTLLNNVAAIIDTGTDYIHGNPSQVHALHITLGGTRVIAPHAPDTYYYSFPCRYFPIITITLGGTLFPIPPSTLIIGRVSHGSSDCVSGIVGSENGASFWTVGNIFLQEVYTTFDIDNLRVGFAQLTS